MNYPPHIDLSVPCNHWTGLKNNDGYGVVVLKGKPHLVHRVAYALEHGKLSSSKVVCHACDERSCREPAHLFIGTHADNSDDKVHKARHPRGATHPASKLTEAAVLEIKTAGPRQGGRLAKKFGVSRNVIYSIRSGRTWTHLGGP